MTESGGGRDGRHYRQTNDGEMKTQKKHAAHTQQHEGDDVLQVRDENTLRE